jgi:hypothetical protein
MKKQHKTLQGNISLMTRDYFGEKTTNYRSQHTQTNYHDPTQKM